MLFTSSSSSSTLFHAPILHEHHPRVPLILNPNYRRTLSFLHTPPLQHTSVTLTLTASAAKSDKSGEQKLVHEGLIIESLPNGMFRVRLDNDDMILGYISGKIRKNYVRILPGDRVRVEVSRYDSSKGRIVYRLRTSTPS
ncbi:hypothetical protein RJT34_15465 [Clitoria ternatea]|uniref:Translation initiation factor IF-1, chloroplastic n=1 Tax=Clitoria ternatea TaxID=43366 RepID=A0AAN9J8D5_CLITE